jgi:broad specificity phosphatase PhoE
MREADAVRVSCLAASLVLLSCLAALLKFSSLGRVIRATAQQTLAAIAHHSRQAPVTHHDLREVDFGDWTGLKWDEVRERFQVSAFDWLSLIEQGAIQNGECAHRLQARVEPCLRTMLAQHAGQSIAVVCHGGVIRMILAILIDVPLSKTAAFEIDYASVTEASVTESRTEIQLLNFAPWRGRE